MGSMDGADASSRASLDACASPFIARLREQLAALGPPVFVGLDGPSGAGKSTLAGLVADRGGFDHGALTVIEGDQFYSGGSAEAWDRRAPHERVAGVIDRHRQRGVLLDLRERGVATWHPFDWEAEDWDRDTVPLAPRPIRCRAASVVLLEGAYSCHPELHDLLDLRVLLDVPLEVRRRQLLEREGHEYRAEWEARWSAAEDHYFTTVMPPQRFDLVLRVEDVA